jgi:glycolate oxidase
MPIDAARRSRLARALADIVGREAVVADPSALAVYECDALTNFKAAPDLVVLPASTGEVAAVVRLARAEQVPVVPRGEGTGLSGGALAVDGGIIVGTSRMRAILDTDYANLRATVQAGLVNIHLSEHLAPRGYLFAPDPSSQYASSIGGNVAENSGGPHCLKYGVTTNHILGLTLVLADGDVVRLGGPQADPLGYDLVGLVVGSEGTFGIVTEVVVRIVRAPQAVRTLLGVFETMDDASAAVSGVIGKGIIPAALEMMDRSALEAVEAAFHAGYPYDCGAVLLVELDGLAAGLDDLERRVVDIFTEHRSREVKVARTDHERTLLWKGRKMAFGAMGRLGWDFYLQDAVVPRTKLPAVLGKIQGIAEAAGLRVANMFHAGDGNLHPCIIFDGGKPGELERAAEAAGRMMEVCIEAGGCVTGEHGIGCEKTEFMGLMFSKADLDAMTKVRAAFDPENRVNPGKIFPTPGAGHLKPSLLGYRPHAIESAGIAQRF